MMKILGADGIDHINIYSKGKTELGRLLSNFAHTPFRIPFIGTFQSVEGFWYYCLTDNDNLKSLHGLQAKSYGKQCELKVAETKFPKRLLKIAYKAKLRYHPSIEQMLLKNELPLVHYYVYDSKKVIPKQFQWTSSLWEEIKQERL